MIRNFLFYIMLASGCVLTAQENFKYKAIYNLSYQPDSTDISSKQSESMVLYIGENFSRFSSLGKAVEDSLMETVDLGNKSMSEFARIRSLTPETKFNYKIFKNPAEGKIQFVEKIFKDKFKYEEDLKSQDWQIQAETKEISGYMAQKATTSFAGREYIAWFTPEIPIPDGPYKFNGLPGFIIEIADLKDHYHFKLTGFEILKEPVTTILDLDNFKLVIKKDFIKAKNNFNRDPLTAMANAGVKIGWTGNQEANAKRELKKKYDEKNNPLELE